MSAAATPNQFRAEFSFLLLFVLSLPLVEAPKNLFFALYIGSWLINRARARDFGGRWDSWDSIIAALLASAYASAAFAGIDWQQWKGTVDITRYTLTLWTLKRTRYSAAQTRWLLLAVVVAGVVALAYALYQRYVSKELTTLELNSVGHVNHSAIYLTITFGVSLSFLLAYWSGLRVWQRALGALVALFFAVAILLSDSRGALVGLVALSIALALAWWRRMQWVALALPMLLVAGLAAAYLGNTSMIQKIRVYAAQKDHLSQRDQIWSNAFTAWQRYPVFGIGPRNFKQLTHERVAEYHQHNGTQAPPPDRFWRTEHGHSIYMNTLAEGGVLSFAAIMALLIAWGGNVLKRMPKRDTSALASALWGASFATWIVVVLVGTVNTTLRVEHAGLSALLLGAALAYQRSTNKEL